MARVKIRAQLDNQLTNYSYLSETTVANFQNNVLIKHCFLMGKYCSSKAMA